MEDSNHRPTWKTLLAFSIIYFVWGSTFLGIRVGVREVPPLILAAMRFSVAGVVLFGWVLARGERAPSLREWRSASILGMVIFLFDYGLLFWAEQRVPSGIAAVMLATIPVFMALSEIIFLRTQRLTARLALALLIGIGGVGVLMSRSLNLGGAPIDKVGAMALIFASISWSIASVLARKLPLPDSKVMSSGAQMLAGGILLAIVAGALGEFRNFHPSAVSRGAWLACGKRFAVPTALPGVPSEILDPVNTWKDKAEFDKTARALVGMFQKNFAKFEAKVDADVRAAAPEVKLAAE